MGHIPDNNYGAHDDEILFILFWVGVAVLVVFLVRRWKGDPTWPGALTRTQHPSDASAQEVLDRRLAVGEIEPDEYRRRSDALHAQGLSPGTGAAEDPPTSDGGAETDVADDLQPVP